MRYPGRRGTAVLKRILGEEACTAGMTRSELEDRFLRFLADRKLPAPRTNVWLQIEEDWIEVDCVSPDLRVVVELDSWAHHGTRAAFRRDRARDRRLRLAGWQPIRITVGHR
jgi:very-short-patch-repair endonuclease